MDICISKERLDDVSPYQNFTDVLLRSFQIHIIAAQIGAPFVSGMPITEDNLLTD